MSKSDWPHVDRCTGHGKELPSPLPWSPHLCASGWLPTRQTYLFSCLSDKSKISYSLASWNMFLSTGDKHYNNVIFSVISVWLLHRLFSYCKTHPGCTKRPSPHSGCALRWWFDPGSHRSHVWTSVSRGTWCRHPRPKHGPWCGQTSYGTRWTNIGKEKKSRKDTNSAWYLISISMHI